MTPDAVPVRRNGLAAVMSRPQFLLLVIGQTVSQLGDRLHQIALFALVDAAAATSTTGLEVGKLGVVFVLPTVFSPVIGALVDRWNKRTTMMACDIMRAIIVAMIPWLYHTLGYIWPAYVVAFFVGLFGVFFNAAKMALIPDLVDRDHLMPANAALATIGRLATVTGFVGGGFMIRWDGWRRIGWEGYEAGFYLDAASYGLSVITLAIIMLLFLHHARRQATAHTIAGDADIVRKEVAHLRSDMRSTFRLMRTHHGLRFVFLMVMVLGLLAASVYVIMTTAAMLNEGVRDVSFLGGLLAGGMILGGLLVGTIGSRWDRRWLMVAGCLIMSVLMVGSSMAFSLAVFLPVAFLGGVVLAPVMVSMDTLLHENAPAASRALVFSTRDLVLGATFMVCSLMVGGVPAVLGAMGADDPYALTLFIFGILVAIGAIAAAMTQRHQPESVDAP